jgi:hypothetical protein
MGSARMETEPENLIPSSALIATQYSPKKIACLLNKGEWLQCVWCEGIVFSATSVNGKEKRAA